MLWIITYIIYGLSAEFFIYSLLIPALMILSIADEKTREIPPVINFFILTLGIIMTILRFDDLLDHILGFFAVSSFIFIIILITHGRGMGGGDMKLMAAAGLLLGWKEIILAFFIGSVAGAVIHLLRMLIKKAGPELAFGPYLSFGIIVAMWFNFS